MTYRTLDGLDVAGKTVLLRADLNVPVRMRICPTVREPDGLALSSRNQYLSVEERKQALVLHRALCAGRDCVMAGQRDGETVRRTLERIVADVPAARLDYAAVGPEHAWQPRRSCGPARRQCRAKPWRRTRRAGLDLAGSAGWPASGPGVDCGGRVLRVGGLGCGGKPHAGIPGRVPYRATAIILP